MGLGHTPPEEAWNRSERSLAKTLELNPNSSLAHTLLGMNLLLHHCDRAAAEKELETAVRLDPNDMDSVDYHSYYLLTIGENQRAIAEKRRVVEHDPVAAGTKSELGMYLETAGQFDEAIKELEDSLELDPNSGMTRVRLGTALLGNKQYENAVAEIRKAISIERRPRWLWRLSIAYFQWGKIAESKQALAELIDLSKKRYVSPILIAELYAIHGDREQSIAWLGKVKSSLDVEQAGSLSDSQFDSIRSDPRFTKIEARLKNAPGCH
jgi:tetratricopeptide (TPR) repeat protein